MHIVFAQNKLVSQRWNAGFILLCWCIRNNEVLLIHKYPYRATKILQPLLLYLLLYLSPLYITKYLICQFLYNRFLLNAKQQVKHSPKCYIGLCWKNQRCTDHDLVVHIAATNIFRNSKSALDSVLKDIFEAIQILGVREN